MAELSSLEKYKIIFKRFCEAEDGILTAYDQKLKEDLRDLSHKQIGRLLQELEFHFDGIVELEKKNRKKRYKLLNHRDIFTEYFKNNPKLEWLFALAKEADPEILKDLEKFANPRKDIFVFRNCPFEEIPPLNRLNILNDLQTAVKRRKYINIYFKDEAVNGFIPKSVKGAKALKLVFMDGNWYIAYVDKSGDLKFGRVSFIKRAEIEAQGSYGLAGLEKYFDFIDNNLQNCFSLYGVKPQKALIKATPYVSHYFKKGMKTFLPSQKFEKEIEDGSVIFSLKYTQEMEILPFIQRWLPDLIILEPLELKESYLKKLRKTEENLSK